MKQSELVWRIIDALYDPSLAHPGLVNLAMELELDEDRPHKQPADDRLDLTCDYCQRPLRGESCECGGEP